MDNSNQKIVLMVENNLDHIELAMDAFLESGLSFSLKVLRTGNEALDYLFPKNGCVNSNKAPKPQAIMIDVQTAGWQGFDLLEEILAHNNFERVPIVMLSSSVNPYDKQLSKELGADDFMLKPLNPVHIEHQFKKLGLI